MQAIKTPPPKTARSILHDAAKAIFDLPLQTTAFKVPMQRLLDAFLALLNANQYLRNSYEQAKIENAALHHALWAMIRQHGEVRFSQAELGAAIWGKRIEARIVPGTTDIVFSASTTKGVVTVQMPRWLEDGAKGLTVPELTLKVEALFKPVFDITDLDATKPKALS